MLNKIISRFIICILFLYSNINIAMMLSAPEPDIQTINIKRLNNSTSGNYVVLEMVFYPEIRLADSSGLFKNGFNIKDIFDKYSFDIDNNFYKVCRKSWLNFKNGFDSIRESSSIPTHNKGKIKIEFNEEINSEKVLKLADLLIIESHFEGSQLMSIESIFIGNKEDYKS